MNSNFKMPSWRLLPAVLFAAITLNPALLLGQNMPPDIKQAFESATVTEDDMLNGPGDTRKVLMDYMKENWNVVFDHLEEVAPTRTKKAVLIRAAESLEPQEYFTFLKTMKVFREAGRLSAEEFDDVIFPSRNRKGFLAYNYQNPEIHEFVTSVRPLVTPKWQRGIDNILSGKSMKHREEIGNAGEDGVFDKTLLLSPDRKQRSPKSRIEGNSSSNAPTTSGESSDSFDEPMPITSEKWFWPSLSAALILLALACWKLIRSKV